MLRPRPATCPLAGTGERWSGGPTPAVGNDAMMPSFRDRTLPKTVEWVLIASLLAVPAWRAVGWRALDERPPTTMPSAVAAAELIEPGAIIDPKLLGLPHGKGGFVLFTSTTCPFSEVDAPFYRTVSEWMRNATDGHFVVVSDDPLDTIRDWLNGHAIIANRVVGGPTVSSLYGLGVLATPTVALVGDGGIVTDLWVGELAAAQEAGFMAMLESGLRGSMANLADPPLLKAGSFDWEALGEDAVVLDVRDRGEYRTAHDAIAVNIPVDELGIRAGVEIDRAERVFVDCRFGSLDSCRHAARGLVLDGFARVTVIVPG